MKNTHVKTFESFFNEEEQPMNQQESWSNRAYDFLVSIGMYNVAERMGLKGNETMQDVLNGDRPPLQSLLKYGSRKERISTGIDYIKNTYLKSGVSIYDALSEDKLRHAIDIAQDYVNGKATAEDLNDIIDDLVDANSEALNFNQPDEISQIIRKHLLTFDWEEIIKKEAPLEYSKMGPDEFKVELEKVKKKMEIRNAREETERNQADLVRKIKQGKIK